MRIRSWRLHLGRLLAAVLLLLVVGWISGYMLPVFVVAAFVYLGWHLYNSWNLHRWLATPQRPLPESKGIWADIFDRINGLQKQERRHRKQLEAVILEFRHATDAFPDATLVIDQNDIITWFNSAASELLGFKPTEDLGQPVTNLLRDPDFANWLAVQSQVKSTLEMISPIDSEVFLNVSAVQYREGQRLLIMRDVTNLRRLEQVRQDFVANVSHELRTPLTVLIGYLEVMQEQSTDSYSSAVTRMQDQAKQMQALLDDLLELSRLQNDTIETEEITVDVPALMAQVKEQAEEYSKGQHQLSFSVDPELHLKGVPQDLASVFRNLVVNAIRYTPEEGKIEAQWLEEDGLPVFLVRDNGVGIPKRDIPRLTERFYRVGSDRAKHTGGTGLGLSIVKHVLNAHQARLVIHSELGEGSEFRCEFPEQRLIRHKHQKAVSS